MAGEPRWHRQEREQRERELYPELKLSNAETVFEVDKLRRMAGRQPTSIGRATEDTLVRTFVASDTYQSRERELRARPNPSRYGGSPDEFFNRYGDLFDPAAPINNIGTFGNTGATTQLLLDQMALNPTDNRQRIDEIGAAGVMRTLMQDAENQRRGPISQAVSGVANAIRPQSPEFEFPVGGPATGLTARPGYQPTPLNLIKSADTAIVPGAPGILDEFTRPTTLVGAAVPGLSFARGASLPTRVLAEGVASGVGREAGEEVYERTEGIPEAARVGLSALVGIGTGVGAGATVGGLGSIAEQGVKSGRVSVGMAIRDVSGEAAENAPRSPAESARAKLIDALTEERRLRTTGIATREIKEGRRAQYAAIDSARDAAVREGLEGDALQRSLEAAARTGTLRRTFPKLELDDAEFTTLIRQLNEAPKDIASGYDAISLGRALSDWRSGTRPPQPKQIQAIGRILGGEVQGLADDLAREAKDHAQDQGTIQRLRELYDRLEARQTAQAGRQAERDAGRAIDTRIRELGDLEGARIPRPHETTLKRALEDVKFADDPQGVRRAQKIVAAYEADQMKAAAEVAADLQKQADIVVQMERLQARAISRADDAARREARNADIAAQRETRNVSRANRSEQRIVRQAQRSYPTRDLVLERVAERIRKTAEGADPVSEETVRQAQEVADVWVTQNRALLDRVNEGGTFNPFARMTATIRGDVKDPFINAALVRESLLSSNLQRTGVSPEDAKKIARLALDSELMQRYQVGSPKAVPAHVRDTIREARNIPYDASVGGIQRLNREAKSTMFGLADAGIFGQQVPAALRYGGIPAFTGYINRLLGMLQLPHVQTIMSDINLPKQMQYALDGVDTSIKSSGLELGSGTLLRRIPVVGESIDSFISPIVDWWSNFQFDTVFGNLRQAIYEGDLIIAKLTGSDISDPAVRAISADYANHITSSSRLATNATRRAVEELTFTSPSMQRARIARVNDMLKLIGPTSAREERVMAASMILSTAAYHTLVGGMVHALYGIGDFETDFTKSGFGKITTRFLDPEGNNYIVDFVPQDSIDRAVGQSIAVLTDELAENPTEGLEQLATIWARAGISSASPVARLPLAGAGFSFDRSSGYNIGRYPYSAGNFLLQSAPIPPVLNNLISGETKNIAEGASEVLAVPLYPESGFGEVNRRADDLFGDSFEELDPSEIRTILAGMDKAAREEARSYVRNVVKEQVAETGFDEIETGAWEAVRNLYPGAAEDFETFRTEREAALEPLYANEVDVDAAVDKAFNALPIVRAYRDRLKNEREEWVRENAESGLANLAVDYNFIESNERIRSILGVLSPARSSAPQSP